GDLREIAFGSPRRPPTATRPPPMRAGVKDEGYAQRLSLYLEENRQRDARAREQEWMLETDLGRNVFLRILGVHTGQYNEPVPVRKIKRQAAEANNLVVEGDRLQMPSSMTIVAPSWEILNLLELPFFKAQRKAREMRDAEKSESTPTVVP